MLPVSEFEFWVFFGILLVGRLDGTNKYLWTDPQTDTEEKGFIKRGRGMGEFMLVGRFNKRENGTLVCRRVPEGEGRLAGCNGWNYGI